MRACESVMFLKSDLYTKLEKYRRKLTLKKHKGRLIGNFNTVVFLSTRSERPQKCNVFKTDLHTRSTRDRRKLLPSSDPWLAPLLCEETIKIMHSQDSLGKTAEVLEL